VKPDESGGAGNHYFHVFILLTWHGFAASVTSTSGKSLPTFPLI
jgi:hypothetical protein